MLIFDQLKKNDPPLRALTLGVLIGLGVLLVGLWWVQIVLARGYQASLETQSFRTVRVPALRAAGFWIVTAWRSREPSPVQHRTLSGGTQSAVPGDVQQARPGR